MGRVWESNSNLGSHPFLKNVFLTSWASKCLEMHAQAISHPHLSFLTHSHSHWDLSHSWSLLNLLPQDILPFSSLLHAHNLFSMLLGECEEGDHDFGVWRGRFFPYEQAGSFPHVFLHFSCFLQAGKLVFGLSTNWRRDPWFLGGCWVHFFPRETPKSF